MGLFSLDRWMLRTIRDRLLAARTDPARYVGDVFEEEPPEVQAEVRAWLGAQEFSTDAKAHEKDTVTIIPGWPLLDVPPPQVAVALLAESPSEWGLGEAAGDATPVYAVGAGEGDPPVAWDREHGYRAMTNVAAQITASSWDETHWLSSLCHWAVLDQIMDLAALGVSEVSVSLNDLRPDLEKLPSLLFARQLTLTAKVPRTYRKRIPAYTYQSGVNRALEELT